ncbi:MAG: glycosyltransferase [Acidimicrobiia bacterium]|nr:glycosyltransferase [Acidimicrobiia bacterium]
MTAVQNPMPASPATAGGEAAVLPPVVVVVVARDPGPWFEETLRSIDAQTYSNLSVLVVDAASTEPVAARVAAVLPDARERRLEENPGFGPACNRALEAVRGAAFYLLCHDDVRLAPDAIQLMVEEAFRANAGIVGPKLVRWDEPQRLLSVGMGADRWGEPAPLVESGELDQGQHDAVRDVFYVPGAATLVRADLFAALGGFDPGIDLLGEDLDLCWRAHVAGASVVVAAGARVAHLEALALRRERDDRRRLQLRHRQRTWRVCSTPATRLRLAVPGAVLGLVEMLVALVLGRLGQVRDVVGAWVWNVRRRGEIRAQRRALDRIRATDDADVHALMVAGSARVRSYLRGRIGRGDDRLVAHSGSSAMARRLRRVSNQVTLAAWTVVLAVLVIGTRGLLGGPIPSVGDLVTFGGDVGPFFSEWLGGYTTSGMGAELPAPPGLGLFGALSALLGGAPELARSVLILGALPVGVIGAWRLAAPVGSPRARVAALVVFVANPLAYNALAEGRWTALVLIAASPWLLLYLARASGVAPFGPAGDEMGVRSKRMPLWRAGLALGLVTAVVALWLPAAPAVVAAMAVALVVGGIVVGQFLGWWRLLAAAVGAAAVTVVLLAPWSINLLSAPSADELLATSVGSPIDIATSELLRFQTGPVGGSPLAWALPVAASLGVLIGRSWRLAWAARAWTIVVAAWAVVEVAARGWLPDGVVVPAPEVLLAPAAAALALAAAMGVASFEVDLPDYHFGWRQLVSVVAAAAVVVSFVPLLGAASDGRWYMPTRSVADRLVFAADEAEEASFRVLWVGTADLVPVAGRQLDVADVEPAGSAVWGTSWSGPPGPAGLWLAPPQTPDDLVGSALDDAVAGGTFRLGERLAPMGIRYVVLPEAEAVATDPADAPRQRDPLDASGLPQVAEALERQLDLAAVPLGGGVRVFENDRWAPAVALIPPDAAAQLDDDDPAMVLDALSAAEPVMGGGTALRSSGEIPGPGRLYVASERAEGWTLEVDGVAAEATSVGSWAMGFEVDDPGQAVLEHRGGAMAAALSGGPALLWLLAVVVLVRTRQRRPVDPPVMTSAAPRRPSASGGAST